MTEVSMIAATFHGNKGAEAMLSTTIGMLRKRGCAETFHVFTYYPERDRQLVSDEAVVFHSSTPLYLVLVLNPLALLFALCKLLRLRFALRAFPDSVTALARSKCLICLAGVSFVNGREKFIAFNVATLLPAVFLGTPIVKFSQALGSFEGRINRLCARLFLPRLTKIFARGDRTLGHLSGIFGETELIERANDVAFLFEADFTLSRSQAPEFSERLSRLKTLSQNSTRVVGICPSVVVERKSRANGVDYVALVAELVKQAAATGACVVLFPNAARADDPGAEHNNDLPLIKKILALLDAPSRKQTVQFDIAVNAGEIHEVIKACDVLAVSRFHAMIGALANTKPVMVIGWSHKYLEVMELFEQADMVADFEGANAQAVSEGLTQLFDTSAARAAQIAQHLPTVRAGSTRQFDYVSDLLAHG